VTQQGYWDVRIPERYGAFGVALSGQGYTAVIGGMNQRKEDREEYLKIPEGDIPIQAVGTGHLVGFLHEDLTVTIKYSPNNPDQWGRTIDLLCFLDRNGVQYDEQPSRPETVERLRASVESTQSLLVRMGQG